MFPFPVFINHREPKCPECGEPENIKQTCRHCRYEYDDEPYDQMQLAADYIEYLESILGKPDFMIFKGELVIKHIK